MNRTKHQILPEVRTFAHTPETAAWLVGLATIIWAIVVDQGTKLWAGADTGGVEVMHNPRYALGVLGGFAVVIVPLGFRYGLPAWIPGLVLGGALSNMIDRARFGGVRDFITTRWAIINVADLFVIAGVLILPVLLMTRSWREYQRQTA
jgi:lipoprotein signal peptidase